MKLIRAFVVVLALVAALVLPAAVSAHVPSSKSYVVLAGDDCTLTETIFVFTRTASFTATLNSTGETLASGPDGLAVLTAAAPSCPDFQEYLALFAA